MVFAVTVVALILVLLLKSHSFGLKFVTKDSKNIEDPQSVIKKLNTINLMLNINEKRLGSVNTKILFSGFFESYVEGSKNLKTTKKIKVFGSEQFEETAGLLTTTEGGSTKALFEKENLYKRGKAVEYITNEYLEALKK